MFILGMNPLEVFAAGTVPGFTVGQRGISQSGKEYVFVQADSGGVTAGFPAVVTNSSFVVDMVDTTNSAPGQNAGSRIVVPQATIAASGWGWGQVSGVGNCRVAASAVKGTILNTTGTAGQLDDDATVGAEVIEGLTLLATNGGSAALVSALFTHPTIGRTL